MMRRGAFRSSINVDIRTVAEADGQRGHGTDASMRGIQPITEHREPEFSREYITGRRCGGKETREEGKRMSDVAK